MALVTIEKSPDNLGLGVLVGHHESNTPEWHDLRRTGIGGSDVAPILGLSPWTSPYTFWAKKTGQIADNIADSDAMEWGRRLEGVILQKFADNHPEFHVRTGFGTYANRGRPWQLANPDGVFEWDDPIRKGDDTFNSVQRGIVEVKTAAYEDDWKDGVPAYYRSQVLWYLQTFGYSRAFVVVLFAGRRYREFEILADDWEMETNLIEVTKFKEQFIDAAEVPPFTAPFTSTYETVRTQNPNIEDLEVELHELGDAYLAALDAYQATESFLNQMRSEVLSLMGTAKRGLIGGEWRVTRQARNGGAPYLVNKKG